MTKLDLDDFEHRVALRQLEAGDYEAVVALQRLCFPTIAPWSREQFMSQLTLFPEGQLGVVFDGTLVASSGSLIVRFADYTNWDDWQEVSDHGYIRNHDPEGDTLYGVETQVSPDFRGMKLARRLYDARKNLVRAKNLARMVVGGRIPGYAAVRDEMTAREYVERVSHRSLYDPVLTTQLANGFNVEQIIADEGPEKEDAGGYATYLSWPNIDYIKPRDRPSHLSTSEPVRVGFVQYQYRSIRSWEDFERQCRFFVDIASDRHADFVLFPELFTLQLRALVKTQDPAESARAIADFTPRYLELFTSMAIGFNINIIGGSQFVVEEGHLFNIAYLFRRDGTLDKQYKIQITPDERRWWGVEGGDRVRVFDTDRGKVAILICYDVEFPELARVATEKGARILFVPFNTDDRYGNYRVRLCAQARCIENQIYVVTSGVCGNLVGYDHGDSNFAESGIFTPSDIPFARDGVAVSAAPNVETAMIHDLDLELLRRTRLKGVVRNWGDRRRDLYRVVWKADGEKIEV